MAFSFGGTGGTPFGQNVQQQQNQQPQQAQNVLGSSVLSQPTGFNFGVASTPTSQTYGGSNMQAGNLFQQSSASAPAGGAFNFGSPSVTSSTAPVGFGGSTPASTNSSIFGTKPSAPGNTFGSTGFNVGGTAPAFSVGATNQPAAGALTGQQPNPSFPLTSTPATSGTSLQFGNTPTTGFGFPAQPAMGAQTPLSSSAGTGFGSFGSSTTQISAGPNMLQQSVPFSLTSQPQTVGTGIPPTSSAISFAPVAATTKNNFGGAFTVPSALTTTAPANQPTFNFASPQIAQPTQQTANQPQQMLSQPVLQDAQAPATTAGNVLVGSSLFNLPSSSTPVTTFSTSGSGATKIKLMTNPETAPSTQISSVSAAQNSSGGGLFTPGRPVTAATTTTAVAPLVPNLGQMSGMPAITTTAGSGSLFGLTSQASVGPMPAVVTSVQGLLPSTSLPAATSVPSIFANTATSVAPSAVGTSKASTLPVSVPTTTAPASTAAGASMNFRQLEESINKWTLELEEQEKVFLNQATQVNAWDQMLIQNGDKITKLHDSLERVKLDQQRLDHEIDFIVAQQRELEELLIPLEQTMERMPGMSVQQHSDEAREQTYQLADSIDAQLKRMAEDLKDIITHLNTANVAQDPADPIHRVGKILNAHMDSLQWIEQNTNLVQRKLEEVSQLHEIRRKDQERRFRLAYE